jgi:hypothetical protein
MTYLNVEGFSHKKKSDDVVSRNSCFGAVSHSRDKRDYRYTTPHYTGCLIRHPVNPEVTVHKTNFPETR